jgi:hypothetical protein
MHMHDTQSEGTWNLSSVSSVSRCFGAIASRCRFPNSLDHISRRQTTGGATDEVLKQSMYYCMVDGGVSIRHSSALGRCGGEGRKEGSEVGLESRSSGTRSPKWSQPAETALNPAEAPMAATLLSSLSYPQSGRTSFFAGSSTARWLAYQWHTRQCRRYQNRSQNPLPSPRLHRHGSFQILVLIQHVFPSQTAFRNKRRSEHQGLRISRRWDQSRT